MKYKHIEASREARLWIGQVIVPAFTCAVIALSNDKVRNYAAGMVSKVKSKFHK